MYSGIQCLRAFAAIAVVLFHAGAIISLPKYGGLMALDGWWKSGDLGPVDKA